MSDLEQKTATNTWAVQMEPGENLPLEHELFTRYVVVQASDAEGMSVPVEYRVISDTRLQVTLPDAPAPITVVVVG